MTSTSPQNIAVTDGGPALIGQSIICFAKDWNEDPTSNNHVMRELAKNNRVLWLNSIATRTPSLTNGRDLRKILHKLVSFFQGAQQVDPHLWVYTPLVLPFPHSRVAMLLNRWILQTSIRILRRRLGMRDFQLWTFLPNVANYLGRLGESLVVYYCVDEWSMFSYIAERQTVEAEQQLCRKADIVFATSHALVERRRQYNPETHLATHGVDYELFSQALHPSTPIPADLAALPQPVLGFYGTIQDWVDLDLVGYVAARHPEWSIVLIGRVAVDVSALRQYPNVHFLGRRPHSQLPAYCRGLAVGLLPQKVNDLTLHMNPIKLREYLCAGLPVVATALPEVNYYRDQCYVAQSYQEFESAVADALRSDSPQRRQQRNQSMQVETWELKVRHVSAQVMRVKAAQCARKPNSVRV
jgi:glycosyltransferase involved in cell wall biosynthesis